MTPTRFDIYIRQGGRWRRYETLEGVDKDAAILRSAELDGNGSYDGVRAMAVVEYGSGRPPLETLAWISPHLNKTAAVKRQMQSSVTAAEKATATRSDEALSFDDAEPVVVQSFVDAQGHATAPTSPVEIPDIIKPGSTVADGPSNFRAAMKVLGAGCIALGLTAVLFVPISSVLRNLGPKIGLAGAGIENTIFATTLLVFILSAAVLMYRVYREFQTLADQFAEYEPPPPPPASPLRRAEPELNLPRRPLSEATPPPAEEAAAEDDPDTANESDGKTAPGPDDAVNIPSSGGLTHQMRHTVLGFLANALAAIKDEVPKMNQHVNFGLNLFGAGAAERYGEHAGLKRVQSFVLVREVIGALGNSEERVDAFCRNYEEYRTQERFRLMINAGRATMDKSINGDTAPFENFTDMVKMWTSDSAARAQVQGIVCIMFTDLVGSTQMTHERGDYGAQEIVRIHNAIVRTALAGHHGREVKHTGDGIMASFTSAANAVRAAMQIREALTEHNSGDEQLQVRVRMGLNAGEAVQEEDDFFGTTVQLSARVCDKAAEGEIFVTDNVRELSKGQGLVFEDAGKFEMKGIPEPLTLYRVGWTVD